MRCTASSGRSPSGVVAINLRGSRGVDDADARASANTFAGRLTAPPTRRVAEASIDKNAHTDRSRPRRDARLPWGCKRPLSLRSLEDPLKAAQRAEGAAIPRRCRRCLRGRARRPTALPSGLACPPTARAKKSRPRRGHRLCGRPAHRAPLCCCCCCCCGCCWLVPDQGASCIRLRRALALVARLPARSDATSPPARRPRLPF